MVEFVFNIDPIGLEETSYNSGAVAAGGKGKNKARGVTAGRRSLSAKERMGRQSSLALWAAVRWPWRWWSAGGISFCR